MSDDWQIRPLQSRGPYSAAFLDKIWDMTKSNGRLHRFGLWQAIPGIYLHAAISIHEEYSIAGHHDIDLHAPVIWEITFPYPEKRDTPTFPRVITSNIIGEHFENDWTKIFLFHG